MAAGGNKHILKRRTRTEATGRWSTWEILAKFDETGGDRAVTEIKALAMQAGTGAAGGNMQHAIFHKGLITHWFEGSNDIQHKSRQNPKPKPDEVDLSTDPYHVYTFEGPQNQLVARCVAREGDTAMRFLQNAVSGWDIEKITMQEGDESPIRTNHWLFLDDSIAPKLPVKKEEPADVAPVVAGTAA